MLQHTLLKKVNSFIKEYWLYILAVITVVLFFVNYWICNYFYPKDIDKWWGLKQNIYNIIIALCFYIAHYSTLNKWLKFVLEIGIGFCISNCIDRLFFNINTFQKEDYIMIIATIIVAIYNFKKHGTKV